MSPLALGTSHAPTESMVAALQGTEYDTGLDLMALSEIREYFMTLREKYIKEGLLDPKMLATDAKALIYQVPGGMLSNLLSQLKQAGKAGTSSPLCWKKFPGCARTRLSASGNPHFSDRGYPGCV